MEGLFMSVRRKLTPEKKSVIADLIEMYDIKTMSDIQEALKDLLTQFKVC